MENANEIREYLNSHGINTEYREEIEKICLQESCVICIQLMIECEELC